MYFQMSPPHSQDPGVEIQADFGILDPHHRLLHDEVLTTLVRLGQPRLVVLTRNFHLAFSHHAPNAGDPLPMDGPQPQMIIRLTSPSL